MLTLISQENYRRLVPSTGGMKPVADDWLGTFPSRNGSLKQPKHSSSLHPRLRLSILSRADLLTRGAFDGRSMLQRHMVTFEAELAHDRVTAATTTKGRGLWCTQFLVVSIEWVSICRLRKRVYAARTGKLKVADKRDHVGPGCAGYCTSHPGTPASQRRVTDDAD